ncbi:MAG: membrane-bound lytic murein transglycosylase B [Halieaceae bacterium]|jgi:membrane-bound lytic murein transglycosylase B
MPRFLSCICALLFALPALAVDAEGFASCIAGLGERARVAGVDAALVDRVLPTLAVVERVIELDRKQPEFLQTFGEYVAARVTDARVEQGRKLLAGRGEFLEGLLKRYGVPPRYLVAFWGLETNYGSYLGNVSTLDALATLACDRRRSEFFAGEFVDALQLVQREALPLEGLRGSWAGAVGHTQFMPSSYLRYAVDGDGDGQVDLWGSERDALASGANFLSSLSWVPGLRWGRRVELPAGFPYELAGLDQTRSLRAWASLGMLRAGGGALSILELDASLLLPAGHRGPAFLVYDNFRVIMRWNQSQSYALSVGLLADRLAGAGPLVLPTAASGRLRQDAVASAQRALNALGHEVGAADGVVGSRTRAALRAFQLELGLPADGYPDPVTLKALDAAALAMKP